MLADGLRMRVGGVPEVPNAANRPSSVSPLMSEMIAGGAFHAISGSLMKLLNDSSRLRIAENSACWRSARWTSVSCGLHRFSRVRASASAAFPSR